MPENRVFAYNILYKLVYFFIHSFTFNRVHWILAIKSGGPIDYEYGSQTKSEWISMMLILPNVWD